jgi:hypothetical protein
MLKQLQAAFDEHYPTLEKYYFDSVVSLAMLQSNPIAWVKDLLRFMGQPINWEVNKEVQLIILNELAKQSAGRLLDINKCERVEIDLRDRDYFTPFQREFIALMRDDLQKARGYR